MPSRKNSLLGRFGRDAAAPACWSEGQRRRWNWERGEGLFVFFIDVQRASAQMHWLGQLALAAVILCVGGCGGSDDSDSQASAIDVWVHSGQEAERRIIRQQVEIFNRLHPDVHVSLTIIPEGAYHGQVQAAALARALPDILAFDGPYLYNYVWQGKLLPLDDIIPGHLIDDLLPSIITQGSYRGSLYSVASYDSGLGLFARRSRLESVGARIPQSPAQAWTVSEFDTLLAALAATSPTGKALDLKLNYQGEWFAYAFLPILSSAGVDLVHRQHPAYVEGVLNGRRAVAALQRLQSWIQAGYVDPNVDDAAFTLGRVALSWAGHWEYARYREAAGDDLIVLPLPDFGEGTRSGQGSWNWGISSSCERPEKAGLFLQFLLQPEQVLAMAEANGAVPATYKALARSARYGRGGPLHLFARQLVEGYAVPRPKTPAYPIISSAFERALHKVRDGVSVSVALDRAAALIDQDIDDNQGYPWLGEPRAGRSSSR